MGLKQHDVIEWSLHNRPYIGEKCSGDKVFAYQRKGGLLLGAVDGLGHGEKAHHVSTEVVSFLSQSSKIDIVELLYDVHQAIYPCIGAAVGLAYIHVRTGLLSYAGVGNIKAGVVGDNRSRFVSRDGIVGQNMRTPLLQNRQLVTGDVMLMTSDGVQERCFHECRDLISSEKPEQLGSLIINTYGKIYDDASCLVLLYKP